MCYRRHCLHCQKFLGNELALDKRQLSAIQVFISVVEQDENVADARLI